MIVRDSIPTLFGRTTWRFNFVNNTVNLSACKDTFHIVTWVEHVSNPDNNNDTLAYDFVNYCTVNQGVLYNDSNHQNLAALDILSAQYQTSIHWQYSLDAISWINLTGINLTIPCSYIETMGYYQAIPSNPECGPNTTSMVEIRYLDSMLSLDDFVKIDLVTVYPNPESTILNIQSEVESEVVLFNSTGQIIEEIEF